MFTYEILKVTALNYRLIRHRAISWTNIGTGNREVIHLNESGVHRVSYEEFMKGRTLLSSKECHCASQQNLLDYFNKHKEDKFRLISNNCEMFALRFRRECGDMILSISPQRDAVIVLVSVVLGFGLWVANRKYRFIQNLRVE